jgi:hypothetical protein
MEAGRRFWRLKPVERRMVLEAASALVATWAGLRVVGFRRWNAAIERFTSLKTKSVNQADASQIPIASSVAMKLDLAARHLFFHTNCLERSLTLRWLLRRRGIVADLRIGVRKESETFEAHAWIELKGIVLNDADEAHLHFAPFNGQTTMLETQTR